MGLLRKLQGDNPDDVGGESLDDSQDLPPDAAGGTGAAGGTDQSAAKRDFPRPGQPDANDASSGLDSSEPNQGGQPAGADMAVTAAVQPSKGTEKKSDPKQDEEDLPPELYVLQELLRVHNWGHANSSDPIVRANGQVEWTIIESQILNAVNAGYEKEVRGLWEEHAPQGHSGLDSLLEGLRGQFSRNEGFERLLGNGVTAEQPQQTKTALPEPYIPFYDAASDPGYIDAQARFIPDEPFSDPYQRSEWANRPQPKPRQQQAPGEPVRAEQPGSAQGAGGGGSSDLLSKAFSAPFTLSAAAGSLVLGSLKTMGEKAKSFYVKSRINGHAILAQQLDQKATEIDSLTTALKKQGMGKLIEEMRATGRPAREIFDGMKEGGRYEHLASQFKKLMEDPAFARDHAKLENALQDFNVKATRYAKAGVELNLDYSEAIERNLERISASTEGFATAKDGVIKHLQELARQIGERIADLVNNIMGRLRPA